MEINVLKNVHGLSMLAMMRVYQLTNANAKINILGILILMLVFINA